MSPLGAVLLTVHAASVWFCVGLVWIVQVLVYPGFAAIGASPGWAAVHARHTRAMARVVTGPWAVQRVTCAALLVWRPPGVAVVVVTAAGVCGLATVVVTVRASVPCHRRLARGYDPVVLDRLVRTNWWRTAAWTAGGIVALVMPVLAA